MNFDFEPVLDRYAELLVKVGLNLREGQRLIIRAPLEAAPLVRRVAAHAYEGGALLVDTLWNDPQSLLIRYRHAPRDSFTEHSDWWWKAGMEFVENGHAMLAITGIDPDLLKDIDPELVSAVQRTEGKAALPLGKLLSADAVNWCVAGYATEAWAALVFPDLPKEEQQVRLWEAIFRTVRLDTADPLAAWEAHSADLVARSEFLNARQYSALHFTGPGTDLFVGLPDHHRWIGGAAPTGVGISNIANMPTEEVFSAPHRDRVNGVVRATMPLNYGGNLIENFSLTFKDGLVVDFSAEKGEALLRSQIETDDGSARLGEVALVPAGSPISKTGILFYNTLYDENAASHIALGRAYVNCIDGAAGKSDEAFNALGGNTSATHLDFMIGSAEIDVDGITTGGAAEPLMRSGEWVN